MSRRAVLVEASGTPGKKGFLEGAVEDPTNFERFLRSSLGGAWETNEIVILRNPSRAEVLRELTKASAYDYSFVTASGHGHHVRGQGIDETRFCLTDGNEVSAHELNSGSTRCTVIMDCCREVTQFETLLEAAFAFNMRKSAQVSNRLQYRALFDRALLVAPSGCSYLFSCAVTQAAQESSMGGYYSQALLQCGKNWHESRSGSGVFDLWDVHECAARVVTAKEPQQTPEKQLGRRTVWYPFAVHP